MGELINNLIVEQIVSVLFAVGVGVLGFVCGVLVRQAKKARCEDDAIKDGVRAMLHDRIVEICDRCAERGFVHLHNLQSVEAMYQAYHNLGGNGAVTKCVEDFKKLPLR